MKKLVTAACALVAGMVLAEGIESANIVGYQDKPCGQSEFTWTCPTFTAVGGQNVNFTLADIVPSEDFEAFGDTIQFATAAGNWEKSLTFCSEAWLLDNELDPEEYAPGWYAYADEDMEKNLNDTAVPFAKGFCAYTSNSGVTIRFAGEVPQADTPVPCGKSEFTWMGNASVNNLTLADIIPSDAFEAFGDTIQFATTAGNWEKSLTFCSEAWLLDNELDPEEYAPGWYAYADEDMEKNLNDTAVPFGKSFCAYTSNSGVTITIPTPMPKVVE